MKYFIEKNKIPSSQVCEWGEEEEREKGWRGEENQLIK
jgi:hypothetical protein